MQLQIFFYSAESYAKRTHILLDILPDTLTLPDILPDTLIYYLTEKIYDNYNHGRY